MISIIVPVYNRDYCLSRCLDSIMYQTFTDWECVLVDDGSTDGTLEVCHCYEKADLRFRIYNQPNRGVSVARNRGLEFSRGEYIAFIDSDDWIDQNYLQLLYESAGNGIMPLCGYHVQQRDGGSMNVTIQNNLYLMDSNIAELLTEQLSGGLLAGPICKLYDRNIIGTNRLRFPSGINWGEDLIFNYAYYQHIEGIRGVSYNLYHVVQEIESLSVKAKYAFFLTDHLRLWKSVSLFILAKDIDVPPAVNVRMEKWYRLLFSQQIAGVLYVHDRLSWKQRYERMNYLIQSADRENFKKYRFKRLKGFLVYHRLSVLIFIFYEVKFFLMKQLTNK